MAAPVSRFPSRADGVASPAHRAHDGDSRQNEKCQHAEQAAEPPDTADYPVDAVPVLEARNAADADQDRAENEKPGHGDVEPPTLHGNPPLMCIRNPVVV